MKIECTPEEAQELFNIDRVKRLQEYLDNQSKQNTNYDHSSQLAQVMIAMIRFFANPKSSTAEALRYTLEEFLPDQKILQIKVLREVTRAGLKETKNFLEGESDWLPAPID